jgi:hypothetical protein
MSDPVSDAERRRQQKIQRQLDEALEDSFPASDPVAIVTSHEEEYWAEDSTEKPAPPAKPVPRPGN